MLLARVLDGRENIAFGKGDEGIGFIVFEVRVEIRRILFDKVAFKNQALMLVGRNHILEGMDLGHQERDLGAIILEVDVLTHTGPKLLCLADVDYLALLVLPKINSRLGRHAGQLVLNPLKPFVIQRPAYTFSSRSNSISDTLSRMSLAWERVRLPDA